MKKLMSFLIAAGLCLATTGCTGSGGDMKEEIPVTESSESTQAGSVEQTMLTIGAPKAPPTLPILRMMESNALGEKVKIQLDTWEEPESLIAMVQDGKHDMFAFPLTVAAKLYNKGMDIRLTNVNTWGVTYFMTSDPEFKTWEDLKGKTVYVPLQSSPPDALTQYFINEAGLEVGSDVSIIYASTSEVASMLISGEAEYATLIEPQVTKVMKSNENVRTALSFEKEWKRVTGTDTKIPNAGFGTKQSFIDQYPELVKEFEAAYLEAAQWVNDNPEEAGILAEKYLGINAGLITKAIPNMGLEYVTAIDSREELDMFYELLNNFDSSMIGGKIPESGLYYAPEQ